MPKKGFGAEKPVSAAEQKPEAGAEKKEGGNENQKEYQELVGIVGEVEVLNSEQLLVEEMNSKGCQELIQAFGQEKFIHALRDSAADWKNFSVYRIINKLEPDKAKRLALYDQMRDLLDANEAAYIEGEAAAKKGGDAEYQKWVDSHGSATMTGGFSGEKHMRQTYIDRYKSLDSLPDLISKAMVKYGRMSALLTGNLSENRKYVLNGEQELAFLEKIITEAKGDLSAAGAGIENQAAEKMQDLEKRTTELIARVQAEVQAITEQIQAETDRNVQDILADIAALNEKRMGTEQMNRIMGVALQKGEGEIQALTEAGQKKIESMTAAQNALLNDLEGIRSFVSRGY